MVSVENFYWTLHENLLRPSGIDCWYHYPFGSVDNISRGEFAGNINEKYHALFHFDQEPIWNTTLGNFYDRLPCSWSSKTMKLLANSEHSEIKKRICRDRHFLDWYFFYHGFASLDWFRDAEYIMTDHDIRVPFLSLNHLVSHKRSYRMSLTARLIQMEILHQGSVSFHGGVQDCINEIHSKHTMVSDRSRTLIESFLIPCADLPMSVDGFDINGGASARFGHREYQMWQHAFFHLVNETVFYDEKLHLTEKVFKPIVAMRPFVLVASPGNLAYLKSYGFKTFDNWIDESYDSISDHDKRLDAVAYEISKIASQSIHHLTLMYQDMKSVLEYNKNHFFNEFKWIISSELVDNFDSCVCMWNNGRLDDRILPRLQNLRQVKTALAS